MNHNNNLTALRWLAASMVLYGHSFVFLGLPEPVFMGSFPMGPLGVFIFFSISGYLVTQSWESDPDPIRFLQRRALRIFPGLIVCVVLCVFVLGPLLTTVPLNTYFRNEHTWGYFTNAALYITYYLPGVFETGKVPNAVNGSLWSLPAEFFMYLTLLVVGMLRIPKFGWVVVAGGLMLLSRLWASQATEMMVMYRTDVRQVVICGVFFWVGAVFFKYRLSRFFSTTSVMCTVIIWLSLTRWPDWFVMAGWILLPFLMLAFGLANGRLLSRLTAYDYSYGIYIYAFPIQQAVAKFWPTMPLPLYLIVTFSATITMAALSWHWIEKPVLGLKPNRPFKERGSLLSRTLRNIRPEPPQGTSE
jgi:peptidoglycan/LPS O-acetylase OafA/YrhL